MNLLNIDIKNYIPDIVDAYTEVFGKEYRNIIKNKLNNIQYIIYNNEQGINDYVYFLERCKENEEYDEKIEEYRKYGYEERKRKQDILDSKANELFEEIRNTLPKYVLAVLDNKYKSDIKKRDAIFNEGYIDEKADIEYFSKEDNDKLNDPDIEEKDKNWIYYYRMSYAMLSNIILL